MKNKRIKKYFYICFLVIMVLITILSFSKIKVSGKTNYTYTRQGDTVWFGYYPQTKATDEELAKMSANPDENGFYSSGKDKFIKVTNANPKEHYETASSTYIPFNDETEPVYGATYYFKMEAIEWMVMVDDSENDVIKLVSRYYLDCHAWLTEYAKRDAWWDYVNTKEGVPEGTPANGWRYSELRSWLNDGFLNFAFSESERESIYLFSNKNTIDYRENDESTITNDYVAVGNRSDYDSAGNNGRPTDYAIVKGATWCYNKDHIYYYVNASFPNFGNDTIRLYRHDEHEKCTSVDSIEALRPIIYIKRSDAKVIATETQKEEKSHNVMLILGIISLIVGGVLALPMMYITYNKQKNSQTNYGVDYRLEKKEACIITSGLVIFICGIVLLILQFALFGGFGSAKLKAGIYIQDFEMASSGNAVQVGKTAYRLNSDGTYNYTGYYDGDGTVWDNGGTWSQSGSTVTFVANGNPMTPAGTKITAKVMDGGKSFGDSYTKYKLIN